ncbi:cytochrome c-type biogenesis protein [Spongiibacter marinus]|uniref:cytochrome c-type biogenesis protein n=1 Tax=Spongiibacter marinus TaxID=354246 RepID=UPI00041140BC|nr:cytochrome c-type biogenesis protein [Spongiibacter marinus]
MNHRVLLAVLLLLALPSWAVIETYQFDTDLQRQRYNAFIEELRCPKCQNQNLSGSDSAISQDLRRQLHAMIMAGKSDIEITQYMVDRYGDFILYRPRFNAATAVLWLLPVGLLLGGLAIWAMMASRRARRVPIQPLDDHDRAALDSLLSDEEKPSERAGGDS